MAEDFYDLLDVPPDADQEAVRAAFREKATEFHPDVNDDTRANEQFKTVQRAREVLTDPEERAAYDRLGHEQYVAQRMGGLPTHGGSQRDDTEDEESRRRTRRAKSSRSERTRDTAESGGRDDGRYGSGDAFTGQRRRQRAARRRRRLVTEAAALVATLTYLVGVAAFVRAGGGPAIADTNPAAFSRDALAGLSTALAFPIGAALFPVGVGGAAVVADRRRGALVALVSLGPAAGIAAGVESTPLLLGSLLVAPVAALIGVGALAAARRR